LNDDFGALAARAARNNPARASPISAAEQVSMSHPSTLVHPDTQLQPPEQDAPFVVEARFYRTLSNHNIQCELCPRLCKVADGARGHCGVRENRAGVFYSLVHSRVCTAHVDPIEKKPLFHYLPGTLAFSLSTGGCNVHCKFCQNWQIAQARPEQLTAEYVPPERVAVAAARYGCPTIAFTYSEPVVFAEYLMDTADAAHQAGIRSIAVSNGFMQQDALRSAYGKLDAVKIDLKSFSASFYRNIVGGRLQPVLDSITTLHSMGKWLEIVYMVIPTLNDSDAELTGLSRWMLQNLGPDVPLHFSQFHPDYLLKNLPVTPIATLSRARDLALGEGLRYVYTGNVPGHPGENTYCPQCGRMLIERSGHQVSQMHIRQGTCGFCQFPIPGVWLA
jgi:pyruvate formate lyase activating enzyme